MPSAFELNPSFCFTLMGTFAIYLWTRPRRSAVLAVLILAGGLRLACVRLMGGLGAYYGVRWISWGAFLGIASLIVLAAQFCFLSKRTHGSERKSYRQTFYAGAVFPLSSLLIGYTVPLTTWLRPKTYDAFLLAFDGGLGFQPSFVLGRLLPEASTAWGLTTVIYYALPLAACILYASHLASERAGKPQSVRILALFLSLMVLGFAQYGIYPAVGPKHAYAALYPWNPPALAQIAIQPISVPDAPRNCMPSLHLAGALVVWWNSRLWPRWGRLVAALFLGATVFSTLALGEHYLVDLVVALPFTLVFQAAWTASVPLAEFVRRRPVVIGTALTFGWFVLLRYGLRLFLISPLISWSFIVLTVAWCLALERRLSAVAQAADALAARSQ
jgi:PAP2 superfamily